MLKRPIRSGINKRNYEYWKNNIFINLHKMDEQTAIIKANIVCQGQEIDKLKDKIIKLEKLCQKKKI